MIFNLCIPDHKADAFRLPFEEEPGVGNIIASFLFSGLSRWDAQYFLHIALYGYTHENTLAFFPVFPLSLRIVAGLIYFVFPSVFSDLNLTLIAGVLLNTFLSALATVFLYQLTRATFQSEIFAYTSALLFCINPASIFFSTLYSESLFSCLTFSGLWLLEVNKIWYSLIMLSLSASVRSNGILSAGFIAYIILKNSVKYKCHDESIFSSSNVILFLKTAVKIILYLLLFSIPFASYQIYCYALFCTSALPEIDMPEIVLDYITRNDLKLPSEPSKWCLWKIPLAYSYVQSRYWHIGFLHYYTVKQIPNFLLAFPIFIITVISCLKYFIKNRRKVWHSGLLIHQYDDISDIYTYTKCFPYFLHILTVTIFCTIFIHVQVMTRILCSSSPVLYWIAASALLPSNERSRFKLLKEYSHKRRLLDNIQFLKKILFLATWWGKAIFCYFIGYFLVGIFLHTNFFPWT